MKNRKKRKKRQMKRKQKKWKRIKGGKASKNISLTYREVNIKHLLRYMSTYECQIIFIDPLVNKTPGHSSSSLLVDRDAHEPTGCKIEPVCKHELMSKLGVDKVWEFTSELCLYSHLEGREWRIKIASFCVHFR